MTKRAWTVRSALLLCVLSISAAAQQDSNVVDARIESSFRSFADLRPILQEMRLEIDRAQFDRNELLEELDYDDARIVVFAQEQIAFEAYTGLLRGPEGTLLSRAGNSLDQSVFLAAMLGDAGFEARVVEGEIGRDDSARLLRGMLDQRELISPFKDEGRIEQLTTRLSTLASEITGQQPTSVASERELSKARDITLSLLGGITQSGIESGHAMASWEDSVDAAQRYYWVQYRSAASGGWTEAHPAFGTHPSPSDARQLRFFAGEVPEDLLHKLRIQAFIGQRIGDRLNETPVMAPWERPVANVVGATIKYANFPNGIAALEDSSGAAVHAAIAASTFFHPLFNGELAPGGTAFDLLGTAVPPDAAASHMAGLFQELSSSMSGAISALSGRQGADGGPMSLVEQWIQVDLIAPDGATRTHHRFLLAANRTGVDRALALAREVSISVEPGGTSLAKHVDNVLTQLIASAEWLELIAEAEPAAPVIVTQHMLDTLASASSGAFNRDYLASTVNLASVLNAVRIYRPRAAIIATYRPLVDTGLEAAGPAGLDILTDFNLVWVGADDRALSVSFEKTVELGVLQTMLESFAQLPGTVSGSNAFQAWNAPAAGRPLVMTSPDDFRGEMAQEPAARYVLRDLERGRLVIAPPPDVGDGAFTWWRIDPRTGETLGMNEEGWGGLSSLAVAVEIPEYLKDLVALLNATYGGARVTRALTVCSGIVGTVKLAKIGQASGGLSELPPSVVAFLAAIGVGIQVLELAGGEQAFMRYCVAKMVMR